MPQITRIAFLNSARFNQALFPVERHTILTGTNGAGKTTFLRALLFAYLGENNRGKLGIETNKQDFVSFYLGRKPSYLVYEVERGDGRQPFHFAISRPEGQIQFLFIDRPYDERFYIDENGYYLDIRKVVSGLRELSIDYLSPFSDYSLYRSIIYGTAGRSMDRYKVFEPQRRSSSSIELLPEFMSAIFKIEKLDSARVKAAFASCLEDDSIDLKKWRLWLDDFNHNAADIKKFEENQPLAKRILELEIAIKECTHEIRHACKAVAIHAATLPQNKTAATEQVKILGNRLDELESEEKRRREELHKAIGRLETKTETLGEEIAKLRETEEVYIKGGIKTKIEAFNNIDQLSAKIEERSNAHQTLTSAHKSIEEKFESLRQNAKITATESESKLSKKLIAIQETFTAKRRTIEDEKSKGLEERDREAENELRPFENRIDEINESRDKLLEEFSSDKEIERADFLYQKASDQVTQSERLLNRLRTGNFQKEESLKSLVANHKREKTATEAKATAELDQIDSELVSSDANISDLKDRLDNLEESFAFYLKQHAKGSWPAAIRTLKDSFLRTPSSKLGADVYDEPNGELFGISFDYRALPENQEEEDHFDPDQILVQLEKAKSTKSKLNEKRAEAELAYQKSLKQLQDQFDKQFTSSKKELLDLSSRITELDKTLETQRNTQLNLGTKLQQLRESQKVNRNRKIEEIRNQERKAKAALETEKKKFEHSRKELERVFLNQISDAENAAEKDSSLISKKIDEIQDELSSKLATIDQNYKEALERKGVDTNTLEHSQKALQHAKSRYEEADSYRDEITRYRTHRNEFDNIPLKESKIADYKNSIESKKKSGESDEATYRSKRTESSVALEHAKNSIQKIVTDEAAVKDARSDFHLSQWQGLLEGNFPDETSLIEIGDLKSHVDTLRRTAATHFSNTEKIKAAASQYLNKFGLAQRANTLGFHIEMKWEQVTSLLSTIEANNTIGALKKNVEGMFEDIIRDITRSIIRIEKGVSEIKSLARTTQQTIARENFVEALKSFEIRVNTDQPPELINRIKAIEKYKEENHAPQADMFRRPGGVGSVDEIIEAFTELRKELLAYGKDEILIRDCFEIQVRVNEHGQLSGWVNSLDHVGSEGTDKLVKILVYFALIHAFKSKVIRDPENTPLHCAIDEAGILDPKYLEKILSYADSVGIRLIVAGHIQGAKQVFDDSVQLSFKENVKGSPEFYATTYLKKIQEWDDHSEKPSLEISSV